jgi:putative hydrolase of the HAD superfamily
MKYKAIIFDLFGTLVDTYDLVGYASALRETSSILKLRHDDFMKVWNETRTRRTTGVFKSFEENLVYICRELNVPVNKFDINLAKMVRMDYVGLTLAPRQYVIETLAELKKEGYKMALISNCSSETPAIWPITPLAPFFDAPLFSSTTGFEKPDPRIFQLAVEKLGVKPEECLFVDDNSNNLAAAAALGITSVLYSTPKEEGQPPLPEPPIAELPQSPWNGPEITSLPEILDVIEGIM